MFLLINIRCFTPPFSAILILALSFGIFTTLSSVEMNQPQTRTYQEAIEFYSALREKSWQLAMTKLEGISLMPISFCTAQIADQWKQKTECPAVWSWVNAHGYYAKKFKRFEVSAWSRGELQGLSYGRPTQRSKDTLKLELIEGSPIRDRNVINRVFPIIHIAAQVYALMLGADEIRIMNPVNEAVVCHYELYGFVRGDANYLYVKL